jgi:hypothetical protein
MNIFVNTPLYTIEEPKDGDTYYFDNQVYNINVILTNPIGKIRITLCILHEYGTDVTIETSKGNYILNKDVQEMTLVYDQYWSTVDKVNLLPYVNNSFKQDLFLNLYSLARTGEYMIINYNRGSTTQNGKYKMSNLIFVNASNYHSTSNEYDGAGSVLVFKISNGGGIFTETTIHEGYDLNHGIYQGAFGKQIRMVDMGLYDLLIVTAPLKVRDNQSYNTILDDVFGYIYVYSYRKNNSNNFYFHREAKIVLPSIRITKTFTSENINDYIHYNSIFQINPLNDVGIMVSYSSKLLYLYDLRDTSNIVTLVDTNFLPNFVKSSESNIYFSYDTHINKIAYTSNVSNIFTDHVSDVGVGVTTGSSVVVNNIYGVEGFGKIIYPYSEGLVVISKEDFFDFDLNHQLKKRITFPAGILSFDLFENQNERKYFILIDGIENNLYVLDKNYHLMMNDLFKQEPDDLPNLIRTDASGETIFVCASNHQDLENRMLGVGLVTNYDLFFERENRILSSLFPDFHIRNHVLIEEKTLNNKKHFYLEETFKNELPLISNRSNSNKNIEKIYPVANDTGICMEMNYDVSYSSFLSRYAKYFIYSVPTQIGDEYSYILQSSNLYLGWSDNQMLVYNNAQDNEIYLYKKDNQIRLVLLGVGTITSGTGTGSKRWNVIESTLTQDPSQNYYDVSMSLYGALDMLQFLKFQKFVHNNELLFLVHNIYSIKIIDYFSKTVYTKSFERNTSNDLFYIDSFKNLFHIYSDTQYFYLTIYKSGNYNSIILDSVKMDFTTRPYQILGQYFDGAFVLLENYNDGKIIARRFDIIQELKEKIEFEEINISNFFEPEKYIIDVEFFRDTIKKLVLVNVNEKDDKIFQKTSQKIYTLPRLLSTKYKSFQKQNIRQLFVEERNYVNYEQYKIDDDVPNVFYNIEFQKYFKNSIGIFSNYQFPDGKDIIQRDEDDSVLLVKQNERSFSRYVFRPSPNYTIQTFAYHKEDQNVVITAKGVTGSRSYLEIFDVSSSSYVIQSNGEATGISIQKKNFDYEICYGTLDNQHDIFVSEEYDENLQVIKYWIFSKSNQYLPTSYTVPIVLDTSKNACFQKGWNDEYFMDILINHKIVYFQKSGGSFLQRNIDIPNDIQEPFQIKILSQDFFTVVMEEKSFLFVKNQNVNVNAWRYLGQEIYALDTNHQDTFELERYYFVDTDVSNNYFELFQNTNINIKSRIFYDGNRRFYCIQDSKIFKIDHPHLSYLLNYHTVSSDGSIIYTQNNTGTVKRLVYLDHADNTGPTGSASSVQFSPNVYTTNLSSQITNFGYFTLTTNNLGCSKKHIFQPTTSRVFQTNDFPLVDICNNVYFYETPILSKYRLNHTNNQYILDSSSNLSNFKMPVDSDEYLMTNSKFNTLTYKEIKFSSATRNLDMFSKDIPHETSISPDATEFLVYQSQCVHLFKESMIDYPSKYKLYKTLIPSNDLKNKFSPNEYGSIKVDWNNRRIFTSNARISPSGLTGDAVSKISKITILTWNPEHTEYEHHSDICGNYSFGYRFELSRDSKTLFVSEPNAPASNGYQEGKIHIYRYNENLNKFILDKTLRSQKSRIGELMKVSPSMDKIVTYGQRRGIDSLELIIFYDLDTSPKEISIQTDVYDMTFLSDHSLFVEENFTYGNTLENRTFFLLENVNDCPNIFTKVVLPNILFSDSQMMFTLTSFGNNYLIMDGVNISHIIQIKDYTMKYIGSQARSQGSKIHICQDGSTIINSMDEYGNIVFIISW